MKRWLAVASVALALAGPARGVESLTYADVVAIRGAVQLQLDALEHDDADRAFDLATPERRMIIGSPDNFLRMIKDQYNPIYRHRSVVFQTPEIIEGDAIQTVRITDGEGSVWVAVFWMQQGDDKTWKIDGCELLQTTSVAI